MSTRRFSSAGNLPGLEEASCYTAVLTVSLPSGQGRWWRQIPTSWSAGLPVKEKGRGLEADLQSVFPRFTPITCCEQLSYFPLIFISHSVLYNLKLAAKYLLQSFSKQMQYLVQYLVQFSSPSTIMSSAPCLLWGMKEKWGKVPTLWELTFIWGRQTWK